MTKKVYKTLRITAIFCLVAAMSTGCDDKYEDIGKISALWNCINFTDGGIRENDAEILNFSSDPQDITLKALSMEEDDMPWPRHLSFAISEWDDTKEDWLASIPSEVNQPDDFYHVWTEFENGSPILRVTLNKNDTGKERRIHIQVVADRLYDTYIMGGAVCIIQKPEESGTFILKAKYKDRVYPTEAELDSDGNYIFHNQEYADIMKEIDTNPTVQAVILDNETVCYYDDEDVAENRIYNDIVSIPQHSSDENAAVLTRGTGFEDYDSTYLGYISIHDNDHFGGKRLSKGLTNFHFTWNLPNLKDYGMNDKVTSIAVAFNDTSALVCTVLTIWDDTDYNHGDKYRKKHRISIVASKYNPRVTVEDLKKVKKIGSSKSWNDCISSISFHFGYVDRLLLDY